MKHRATLTIHSRRRASRRTLPICSICQCVVSLGDKRSHKQPPTTHCPSKTLGATATQMHFCAQHGRPSATLAPDACRPRTSHQNRQPNSSPDASPAAPTSPNLPLASSAPEQLNAASCFEQTEEHEGRPYARSMTHCTTERTPRQGHRKVSDVSSTMRACATAASSKNGISPMPRQFACAALRQKALPKTSSCQLLPPPHSPGERRLRVTCRSSAEICTSTSRTYRYRIPGIGYRSMESRCNLPPSRGLLHLWHSLIT